MHLTHSPVHVPGEIQAEGSGLVPVRFRPDSDAQPFAEPGAEVQPHAGGGAGGTCACAPAVAAHEPFVEDAGELAWPDANPVVRDGQFDMAAAVPGDDVQDGRPFAPVFQAVGDNLGQEEGQLPGVGAHGVGDIRMDAGAALYQELPVPGQHIHDAVPQGDFPDEIILLRAAQAGVEQHLLHVLLYALGLSQNLPSDIRPVVLAQQLDARHRQLNLMHPLLQEFPILPGLPFGDRHLVSHGLQGCPQQPEIGLLQGGIRRIRDFGQQVFRLQRLEGIRQIGEPPVLLPPAAGQGGKEDKAEGNPKQHKLRRTHAESGQNEGKEQPAGETHQQDRPDFI